MQGVGVPERITVIGGWLICPACKKRKVLRLSEKNRAAKLPVYCKTCKTETIVNIDGCLCGIAYVT